MKILNSRLIGPTAKYSDAYLFVMLYTLDRDGRSSRKGLMEATGLGEGSVRSMIRVLKEWKWVEVRQSGVFLTDIGRSNLKDFKIRFVGVKSITYGTGACQQGVVVEDMADNVTNGMKERDMAIRCGALEASVFIMRNGVIIFPDSWNVDEKDPEFALRLRAEGMKENDLLILVGSETEASARIIAASVALAMR